MLSKPPARIITVFCSYRQRLESVLSKSKSQSTFGDESESTNRKGTSIRRSQTQSAMPRAIEEIQAKLQQSGESGWRKRVQQNNNSNDELRLLNMNRYNVSILSAYSGILVSTNTACLNTE
ncbi:hypothetical protein Zmor_007363 [Zophobas morio]|uniref:Uncharacterized protein n=1 Tax=Zophobas morio TaxID=2755281 RepID=A0AA38MP93_9CUCU|nr:hypothetical protein Zmor_007363 [Zophobas morio]